MTRRGIRQQRAAVTGAKRVWLLPYDQDPERESKMADTLDEVWQQIALESQAIGYADAIRRIDSDGCIGGEK